MARKTKAQIQEELDSAHSEIERLKSELAAKSSTTPEGDATAACILRALSADIRRVAGVDDDTPLRDAWAAVASAFSDGPRIPEDLAGEIEQLRATLRGYVPRSCSPCDVVSTARDQLRDVTSDWGLVENAGNVATWCEQVFGPRADTWMDELSALWERADEFAGVDLDRLASAVYRAGNRTAASHEEVIDSCISIFEALETAQWVVRC